jgi:hypothetical protein
MPAAGAVGARQAQTVHWTVCVRALSSESGCARLSPSTSLHRTPCHPEPKRVGSPTVERQQRLRSRAVGARRSEVKGETWAQPRSEDMSGGGHPPPSARAMQEWRGGSEAVVPCRFGMPGSAPQRPPCRRCSSSSVGVEESLGVIEHHHGAAVLGCPAVDLALPAVDEGHQALQQAATASGRTPAGPATEPSGSRVAAIAISASCSAAAWARRVARSSGKLGVSQGTVTIHGVSQCSSPAQPCPPAGRGSRHRVGPDRHAHGLVGREVAVGIDHHVAHLLLQAQQRVQRQRHAAVRSAGPCRHRPCGCRGRRQHEAGDVLDCDRAHDSSMSKAWVSTSTKARVKAATAAQVRRAGGPARVAEALDPGCTWAGRSGAAAPGCTRRRRRRRSGSA